MHQGFKQAFLRISKLLGMFFLARIITRRGLRILCYHGFSLRDESDFSPETFMEPGTFCKHINLLIENRYPVISLDKALHLLDKKALPSCAVVITFDDGFKTIDTYGLPILREHCLPTTLFCTTYYCINQNPVFRLVIQYMFWKTHSLEIDLSGMKLPMSGLFSLRSAEDRDRIAWQIINYAEGMLHEDDRHRIGRELGRRLDVPYGEIVENGALSIMNPQDIERVAQEGIDIQLHTHRHNFPEVPIAAKTEIEDNRSVLEPILAKRLVHFCYPSGVWSERHFPILKQEGIESAATCDPGFNYSDTHRFALRRFLDGQHISTIEFEAELSGLMEIIRELRNKKRALFHQANRD